jgi:hypothetical protein
MPSHRLETAEKGRVLTILFSEIVGVSATLEIVVRF